MRQEDLLQRILKVEGGYVNDPSDSGGETNWGVTVKTARKAGYSKPMIDMTKDEAIEIYVELYCKPLKIEAILEKSEVLAHEVLDTGVNCGVKRASKFFQRAINCGLRHNTLKVDGIIGSGTMRAFNRAVELDHRSKDVMYKVMDSLQGAFYVELAERREKDFRFIYGWLLNRVR